MLHMIKRLWKDDSAQGLVEYGLIIGLVAVAAIVALGLLGDQLDGLFNSIVSTLSGATTNP